MGIDISAGAAGRARLREISRALATKLQESGHPVFESDGPPSMTAAAAYLEVILGPWHKVHGPEEIALAEKVLHFIATHWREPTVYREYWSEFAAQILTLEPILRAVDMKTVVARGKEVLRCVEARETGGSSGVDHELADLVHVVEECMPFATGERS